MYMYIYYTEEKREREEGKCEGKTKEGEENKLHIDVIQRKVNKYSTNF